MKLNFRTLNADEIDVRVGNVGNGSATLLLYKDARCDMNILDETVGPLNWERKHLRDNANCIVSIYDEDKKAWVSKEDTGTESNTEAEKGLASDSFKRACFCWGIGRELYTGPRIKIKCQTKPKQNGRGYELANPWEFFGASVDSIAYDEKKRITALDIVDQDGRSIFRFGGTKPKPAPKPKAAPAAEDPSDHEAGELERNVFMDACERHGLNAVEVLGKVGWKGGKMTYSQYRDAMKWIDTNGQERL